MTQSPTCQRLFLSISIAIYRFFVFCWFCGHFLGIWTRNILSSFPRNYHYILEIFIYSQQPLISANKWFLVRLFKCLSKEKSLFSPYVWKNVFLRSRPQLRPLPYVFLPLSGRTVFSFFFLFKYSEKDEPFLILSFQCFFCGHVMI